MSGIRRIVLPAVLGLFVSTAAQADMILTPGSTDTLTGNPYNTAGGVAPGAMLIASAINQPISLINGGLTGVTVNEAVYQETSGTLDFLYQVTNGSNSALGNVSLVNYTDSNNNPYSLSTGYLTVLPTPASPTGPFSSLGVLGEPVTATRTAGIGAQVSFTFTPSFASGSTSEIFYLRTNATSFDDAGSITVSGNGSNVGVVFEPVGPSAIPEPSPIALAGLASGLFGIGGWIHRLRRKRAAA